MSFFKLLKSINNSMKEASSKLNDSVEYKAQIHSIDTAFKIEEIFLEFVIKNTEQHLNNKEFYCENFQDVTDKSHSAIALMNEFSKNKSSIMLDQTNDFRIYNFEKIYLPEINNKKMQRSVNDKYMQHLNNRKKRLSKLKDFVNKSDPLTKLFCVYLARSNYPKSDAFEILPKTMESSFDIERSNSKHLKGANFLDSILG